MLRIQDSPFVLLLIALTAGAVSCSRGAASYVDRGNAFYAKGQYDDASLNYKKALQKDTHFGEAYYRMALSELKLGHVAVAYSSFSRAVQLQPENLDAAAKFGDLVLYAYQNDAGRSKNLYDMLNSIAGRLAAKDPKSIDALRFQGYLAVTDRKPDEALRLFRLANSIKPMQPEIILPLVQTLISQNQAPEAEKMALDLMRLHPHYTAIYNVLYYQYLNTNRVAEAEQILKAKVAAEPTQPSWYLELASHYFRTGRTAEMTATLQHLLDNPKDFPQARFHVGGFYAGIGNVDEALRQLTEGAKADGGKTEIYQKKIAELLANHGRTDEAVKALEETLKRHPDMLDAVALHAELLVNSGSLEKINLALNELNDGLKKSPRDAQLHYALGRALLGKRDLNRARAEMLEAIRLNPGEQDPYLGLVEISLQTQRPTEALRFAEQALSLDSNSKAILAHASSLMALSRYNDARSELNGLLQRQPDQQDARLQLGLVNVAQQHFKEGDEIFRKLYKSGSADVRPLEGLLREGLAQHQYDGSIQLLQNELRGGAQTSQALQTRIALASIAMYAGKYDLALEQYQILATANPEVVDFHRRMAFLYNMKGDVQSSLTSLRKAEIADPNDAAAHADFGYALELANRKDEAIGQYRKSLALRPNDPVVCNNLAFLLADTASSLEEALQLAKVAQEQKSGDPGVTDTLGWVYYKQGLKDNALQIFRNLTAKYPNNPAFREHFAAVLMAKGEAAQAREQLQKALTDKPSKSEEEKIRELLRRIG